MKDNPLDFTSVRISNRQFVLGQALENNLINLIQYNKILKDMYAKYKHKPIA